VLVATDEVPILDATNQPPGSTDVGESEAGQSAVAIGERQLKRKPLPPPAAPRQIGDQRVSIEWLEVKRGAAVGPRGHGWEVRLMATDFTRVFRVEPRDIFNNRERSVPASVFSWP